MPRSQRHGGSKAIAPLAPSTSDTASSVRFSRIHSHSNQSSLTSSSSSSGPSMKTAQHASESSPAPAASSFDYGGVNYVRSSSRRAVKGSIRSRLTKLSSSLTSSSSSAHRSRSPPPPNSSFTTQITIAEPQQQQQARNSDNLKSNSSNSKPKTKKLHPNSPYQPAAPQTATSSKNVINNSGVNVVSPDEKRPQREKKDARRIPESYIQAIREAFPDCELYRDILHISPEATEKEIRIAFFQRGRQVLEQQQLHEKQSNTSSKKQKSRKLTDSTKFGDLSQQCQREFQAVSMAYEILTTKAWKAQYAKYGWEASPPLPSNSSKVSNNLTMMVPPTQDANRNRSMNRRNRRRGGNNNKTNDNSSNASEGSAPNQALETGTDPVSVVEASTSSTSSMVSLSENNANSTPTASAATTTTAHRAAFLSPPHLTPILRPSIRGKGLSPPELKDKKSNDGKLGAVVVTPKDSASGKNHSSAIRWSNQVEELVYNQDEEEREYKARPEPSWQDEEREMIQAYMNGEDINISELSPHALDEARRVADEMDDEEERRQNQGFMSGILNDFEASLDGLEASFDMFVKYATQKDKRAVVGSLGSSTSQDSEDSSRHRGASYDDGSDVAEEMGIETDEIISQLSAPPSLQETVASSTIRDGPTDAAAATSKNDDHRNEGVRTAPGIEPQNSLLEQQQSTESAAQKFHYLTKSEPEEWVVSESSLSKLSADQHRSSVGNIDAGLDIKTTSSPSGTSSYGSGDNEDSPIGVDRSGLYSPPVGPEPDFQGEVWADELFAQFMKPPPVIPGSNDNSSEKTQIQRQRQVSARQETSTIGVNSIVDSLVGAEAEHFNTVVTESKSGDLSSYKDEDPVPQVVPSDDSDEAIAANSLFENKVSKSVSSASEESNARVDSNANTSSKGNTRSRRRPRKFPEPVEFPVFEDLTETTEGTDHEEQLPEETKTTRVESNIVEHPPGISSVKGSADTMDLNMSMLTDDERTIATADISGSCLAIAQKIDSCATESGNTKTRSTYRAAAVETKAATGKDDGILSSFMGYVQSISSDLGTTISNLNLDMGVEEGVQGMLDVIHTEIGEGNVRLSSKKK